MKVTFPSMGSMKKLDQAQQGCTRFTIKAKKSKRMRNVDNEDLPPFEYWNGVVTLTEDKLQHLFERLVTNKDLWEYYLSTTM